jgi:hypothetical protein
MDKRKQRIVQEFLDELINGSNVPGQVAKEGLKDLAETFLLEGYAYSRLIELHRRAELLQKLIGGS